MDDYYIELLKSHLLPPLGTMMRNADLSVTERGKAIKNLADGSLAITGSGAGWSAALGDQLHQRDPTAASTPSSGCRFPALRVARSSPKGKISRRLRQRSILKAAGRQIRGSRCILRCHGRLKRAGRRITQSQQRSRSSSRDDQKIQSRVKALQGLVPGGHDMNCSVLLGEAADYMMFLRLQVGVLQSVAAAIERQQQP